MNPLNPMSPSHLLVTGARGQLGSELVGLSVQAGIDVHGFSSAELDITDPAAVRSALSEFAHRGPGVVVNTAAYTAVDAAESDSDRAFAVNGRAPGLLAATAAEHGLGLIHLSTDYVFPGDATRPYQVDDPTGPRTVYGASKLAGEQAVLAAHPGAHVVRTAWVYGATGSNFVKTMARLEASRETVGVVDDQVGSPTWTRDLGLGLLELAGSTAPGGVWHATNAGEVSWCGFARAVFVELGADPDRVHPVTTAEFPRPAPRPAYSVLSGRAWQEAGLRPLPDWRDALAAAFARHPAAWPGNA